MKDKFFSHYPPTPAEFDELWKKGSIVLDANVLLDFYRLPKKAREDFLLVLDTFSERLWIPFQFGLEFQRNRIKVAARESKSLEKDARDAVSSLKDGLTKLQKLELSKREIPPEASGIETKLSQAILETENSINLLITSRFSLSSSDSIRDSIDNLLLGRVGEQPTAEQIKDMTADGAERYSKKIPPGFEDANKDNDPLGPTFMLGEVEYARKFGDLIAWRQIIQKAKDDSITHLMLVTGDSKGDWIWKEEGLSQGPQPGLRIEIKEKGGVDVFWIYSPFQFLEYSQSYTKAVVSPDSVQEVKEIESHVRSGQDEVVVEEKEEEEEEEEDEDREAARNGEQPKQVSVKRVARYKRTNPLLLSRRRNNARIAVVEYLASQLSVDNVFEAPEFDGLLVNESGLTKGYSILLEPADEMFRNEMLIKDANKASSSAENWGFSEHHIIYIVNSSKTHFASLFNLASKLISSLGIDSIIIGFIDGHRFGEIHQLQGKR